MYILENQKIYDTLSEPVNNAEEILIAVMVVVVAVVVVALVVMIV